MTEILHNAWMGWQDYISAGKLAALLGAALIFLWLSYRKIRWRSLVAYTTLAAACCVIPVTAAGLMLYQTKFYDYQWIWSMVPATAVTAYGAVLFLEDYRADLKGAEKRQGAVMVLLLLAVLLLCSGMGGVTVGETASAGDGSTETEDFDRATAEEVLRQVSEQTQNAQLCLWAPREVIEYARETEPSVSLLYGRNMWDDWLNAYAYDTYPEELVSLCRWMEEAADTGEDKGLVKQVRAALRAGANCILLPDMLAEEAVLRLESLQGIRLEAVEGYYLLLADCEI